MRRSDVRWRVWLGAAVVASLAACGSGNVKAGTGQSTGPAHTSAAARMAPVCPVSLTTALSAPPSSPSSASAVTGFAPGSPAAGVLCQYDLGVPADDSSGQLGRYVVLTSAALRNITTDVQALTATNEVASCPPPESVEVVNLVYADESTISLSISCSMVVQGDIHAMLTDALGDDAQVLLAAKPSAAASSPTAQPSVLTCGTVPVSDGKLKTALAVKIGRPTAAPSGGTFTARVDITTTQPTVDLSSSTAVTLLIAQGNMIVGRTLLPAAAAGFEPTITPNAPATLPASITLTGCATPPLNPTNADLTRQPLPPGTYTIYAVVEEYDGDSETDLTNLVSAPFPIQITAAPASPS
jgi:hypothetical protein